MVWDFTFFISITFLKKWYKIVASISLLSTRQNCPVCSSSGTVKNGHIHRGKQRFKCYECGRQFALESRPEGDRPSDQRTNRPIIARTPLWSRHRPCPQGFGAMAPRLCSPEIRPSTPNRTGVIKKKRKAWAFQCDELWSFVDHKGNKQWIWLALDAKTREIVGVYIGARDSTAASQLWKSLPPIYRQCAGAYTDFWAAYSKVLPSIAASGGRPRDW